MLRAKFVDNDLATPTFMGLRIEVGNPFASSYATYAELVRRGSFENAERRRIWCLESQALEATIEKYGGKQFPDSDVAKFRVSSFEEAKEIVVFLRALETSMPDEEYEDDARHRLEAAEFPSGFQVEKFVLCRVEVEAAAEYIPDVASDIRSLYPKTF